MFNKAYWIILLLFSQSFVQLYEGISTPLLSLKWLVSLT